MKINTVAENRLRSSVTKLAGLALGGMLLAGCAGNPPKEQFAVTESAVRGAMSAEATQYAPVEMRSAQDKWRQAELAMQKENYDEARRLAEQAEWDARVAERKARAVKAQSAVQDSEAAIKELREESQRSIQ
ncbi:DUF4398 domain-containing protein [Stutzerimonas azotifigens]|uniref:DUF4398 domain-containing protein n=1 Tax=Stutzerimonas azotifigens TaxID=291995 RepID=UPI000412A91D|nr:DUF4398 domain-containing protein [Stutzerimonas azotifigens]